MGKYTGVTCVACSEKFKPTDDVVVCPVCGAPHHRECYSEKGECALNSNHAKGIAWRHPTDEIGGDGSYITCKRCSATNPPDGIFCSECGERLNSKEGIEHTKTQYNKDGYNPPSEPYKKQISEMSHGKVATEDLIAGIPTKDIAIFLGNNAMSYLPKFKAISMRRNFFNVSWSSFFLNFFYFFYRKMYLIGTVLLISALIMFMPTVIFASEYIKLFMQSVTGTVIPYNQALMDQMANVQNIAANLQFAIAFILGMFGNKLYYMHVIKSIRTIRTKYQTYENNKEYYSELAMKGGINIKAVAIVGLLLFILYMMVSLIIAKNVPI